MAVVLGVHDGLSTYIIDGLIRIERRYGGGNNGTRVLVEVSTGKVLENAGAMDKLITRAAQATLTASYGDDAPAISRCQRLLADGDIKLMNMLCIESIRTNCHGNPRPRCVYEGACACWSVADVKSQILSYSYV